MKREGDVTMKKALRWIKNRAKEPSSYVGLGTIVAIAGAPKLGIQITQVGEAIALIVGGGLIASKARDAPD
jgi:hypothetical protein